MKLIEVKIRLPDEVHKIIKRIAEDQGRSMNKQIIHILKEEVKK